MSTTEASRAWEYLQRNPAYIEAWRTAAEPAAVAEVWGLRPDGSNPCRHVKRYKENKRERFLSPEETERLGEILREAESEMPSAVAAFRLLLLTGCRLSEIQFLRWEYVKDDCIELHDAKTGGRVVPLGPEARAVLADLPREDGNP